MKEMIKKRYKQVINYVNDKETILNKQVIK